MLYNYITTHGAKKSSKLFVRNIHTRIWCVLVFCLCVLHVPSLSSL